MIDCLKIKNKIIGEGRPKICVPLTGSTREELLRQTAAIVELSREADIDMVEFRGDYYNRLSDTGELKTLMQAIYEKLGDIILLFTIRSNKEGGRELSFDTPTIKDINAFVIENKLADIVDVELFSGEEDVKELVAMAKRQGVGIIMSNHDFSTTPDSKELVSRLCAMQELGADIAKVAVMPENRLQVLELLEAVTVMNEKYAHVPVVGISMGALGAVSRITGEIFGSAITFATLDSASAPGQIPVRDVNRMLDDVESFCV